MSLIHRTLVAEAYDQAAPEFARAADPLYRILARPLATALADIVAARSGPVLDVAAGSGAFGRAFSKVVALDIAAGQLDVNGASHRVKADAEGLPFRKDAFSVAASSFGINHLLDPGAAVLEMARVAPVVGLSTWARPERDYAPKRIVNAALVRQVGRSRTELGAILDGIGDQVGSIDAVAELLGRAGLDARVTAVELAVEWPGHDEYLDYRLAMPTTVHASDRASLREDVRRGLDALSPMELTWRPVIVVGVGLRVLALNARRTGG